MSLEPHATPPAVNLSSLIQEAKLAPAPASQMLSAWTDDHLTAHQLQWVQAEHNLLRGLIRTGDAVIDVGCGDARVLRQLAHIPFSSYVGIDTDRASIDKARNGEFDRRCSFVCEDALPMLARIATRLPDRDQLPTRTVVMCIGNTIGTFEQHRAGALRAMGCAADCVIVSVCRNSPEVMLRRLEYYAKNRLPCRIEDWSSGSIKSDLWGESRSFDEQSLHELVRDAKLDGGEFDVSIRHVGEMGIALILNRLPVNY